MNSKINFLLRLIVAIILIQSLYFKFTGHAQAIHIFSTLGAEPWGRIFLGIVESIVGVSLLIPKTKVIATWAALGIMIGALGTHLLTPLGVVVEWGENSDQGQLFLMALIAFLLCTISLIKERIKKHDTK